MRSRRLALLGGITALGLFAAPAIANAVVYCVPNDAIAASCTTGQGKTTIQDAFDAAAASTAVADTVRIGAGSYSEAGLSYNQTSPGNTVNVIGAGTGSTLLTIPDTTGSTVGLTITAPLGSAVSSLAMTIPANADANGDIGIELGGGQVFGHDLLVDGPSASNARGIRLFAGSSVDTSTVDLPFASPSNQAISTLSSDGSSITDSVLHANTGVRHGGALSDTTTVDRTIIQASGTGVSEDSGTINLRDSIVDLGASNGAVGAQAANFNMGTTPMAINLDGDTIVGGGTNSTGVQAQADSDATVPLNEPGDTNHDGEDSTVAMANTILSGQTHSLRVEADRGEAATMTTSYSNYDSSTKVVTSDLTPGGGTGAASLTEDHQTNLSPGFVSSSDFHLADTSPLIDAGDPSGAPVGAEDVDGDPREILGKDGCAPRRDIGADEFVPLTPPTLLDCTPPDTAITSGPSGTVASRSATFDFSSSEGGSTFVCSLDGAPFTPCSSPFTASGLGDGPHTFAVAAIDPSSNEDPTPATQSFAVDATPPETTVSGVHKVRTRKKKARVSFTFSANEPGATFACSLDGGPFATCNSPFTAKLRRGSHTLTVKATDAVGNTDPSPASFTTKVKRKRR